MKQSSTPLCCRLLDYLPVHRVAYRFCFFICLILTSLFSTAQTTQTFSTSGQAWFKVPAGVITVLAECWGGGGAGGGATGNPSAGGGGAGGSYARKSFSTLDIDSIRLSVGRGGSGTDGSGQTGGSSWFSDSTTCKALGGRGGNQAGSNSSSGAGGQAYTSGSFGEQVYYGGSGAAGSIASYGGGGGASAGNSSNGTAATGLSGGTAVTGGSAGASGAVGSAPGGTASSYGGGGGGGRAQTNTDRSGGSGAAGLVRLTYTCPVYSFDSLYVRQICSDTGALVHLYSDPTSLPKGSYTVTYNLSAPNAMSSVTATMTVTTPGYGNFRTALLSGAGNTTITITALGSGGANGCLTSVLASNTASFLVTISPNPYVRFVQSSPDTVSVIQVCSYNGSGSQNDMEILSGNPGGATVIQWEISYDGGTTWSDAPGPSAATALYVLDPLYTNFESNPGTYYFRVILTNGNCTGISNKIRLTVSGNTNVTPGTIGSHQFFCVSGDPAALVSIVPPGGGNNNFNYKWQSSTDSVNFGNINGADADSYNPPTVTQTTYFRRVIFSGGCRKFSNVIRVKVSIATPPMPSAISGSSLVCSGSTPLLYIAQQSADADTYTWSVPGGWNVYAGQGNDSAYIQTGTQSGSLGVQASNACGSSAYTYLPITLTPGSTSATIQAGSRVCQGDSAMLRIQISGGAPPYQIKYTQGLDTTTLSGYVSGTSVPVLPVGTTTYRLLQVLSLGGCAGTGLSAGTTITTATSGTWVGLADSLWENAANWCGGVPTQSVGVTIPYGTPYSPVIRNLPVTLAQVQLDSGAVLRIVGQWLKLKGSVDGSGKLDLREGMLEWLGTTGAQVMDGSRLLDKSLKKLRFSNADGVSIASSGDSVYVTETVDFGNSQVWVQTYGKLVIAAGPAGTASVADMTAGGLYTGNRITGSVTVEKYIPNQPKAWWFLSAPTSGQTIKQSWQEGNVALGNSRPGFGTIITSNVSGATGAAGFDIFTPAGTTLKTYNTNTASWDGLSSTHLPIANTKGYMMLIRGDRSVTAFNQAPTATILRTSGQLYTPLDNPPASTAVAAGTFEAVANPYASAIDFKHVTKTGGIQEIYYVWDPKLTTSNVSSYGLGGYQTFVKDGQDFDVIPGGGSFNSGNKIIASGQSFFVRAVGQAGQLSFTETCKVDLSAANRLTSMAATTSTKLKVRLSVVVNGAPVLLDGANSQFDDAFSSSVDSLDALKIGNSTSEIISIQRGNIALTADRSPLPTAQDTLYYSIGQMKRQTYQLSLIPEHWNASMVQPWLRDNFMNSTMPISTDSASSYVFTVTTDPASWSSGRFYLYFRPNTVLPVRYTSIQAQRISPSAAQVKWEAQQYGASCRFVIERSREGLRFQDIGEVASGPTGKYGYTDAQLGASAAFYRIRSVGDGEERYSDVVRVQEADLAYGLDIFPNPVENQRIGVKIRLPETGEIQFQLYDMKGKRMYVQKRFLSAGAHTLQLTPSLPSSGVYVLKALFPDFTWQTLKVNVP